MSTVLADSDSHASGEADSYTTDSALNEDHAFVIDGGDILTYSTTNIIKANKGSIAFKWKAPLPYNKYTDDFYLIYLHQFMSIRYDISDRMFYFQIYNGTNWSTAKVLSDAQTFGSSDWIKICATWDTSSATTMSFYIDSSTPEGTYASTWTEQAVPATLYVGSYHTSTSQSDGTFDELRIYAVALTAAEVETLFNTTWS
uniref:Putative lectin/glucanase superfamily protein n=1 Tax=viral metagenome TaxID=1070528 RepID=A0A6M3XLK8_9ZZZZ